MKKIIASTIAAGLVLGTTLSAAAQTAVIRDSVQFAQAENFGGDNDDEGGAGTVLIVLLGAAAIAGAIIAIESGEDQPVPTSP
ncbi:MAG: hypothetical protein KDE15_10505 [Erythrobacter sp.]|nr:hypothetical protein [Erythrobacter sp.]